MTPACTTDRIATRAKEMVSAQPHFRGTSYPISFESIDDVLVVSGRLPSFHLKQVLQSALGGLEGITRVVNQVVVDYRRSVRMPDGQIR